MNANAPTLMVVDDEPEVLRSIYDLFRLEYRVLTFERGADALEALAKTTVDVVMSDQQMPVMTGVEFLSKARELQPDATRLLMTGYADIKAVIDAINRGNIWHYITKPWDPAELSLKVRQAAEQHRLRAQNHQLMQALERSNALKSAFLEVASHELNTPVTVILGMMELWKLTLAPQARPNEREYLEKLHTAAHRLYRIVNRMLKLLHAGQFEKTLNLEETPIRTLCEDVIQEVNAFLVIRNQTLRQTYHPALGTALIDADKIRDILTNLIMNAIKFTPDGGTIDFSVNPALPPVIRAETQSETQTEPATDAPAHDWIKIRIHNPGAGIPNSDLPHIFDPFFTTHDTLRHSSGEHQYNTRGIGLGLSLVKTFVNLHQGEVTVTSNETEGTTFEVDLPRTTPPLATANPQPDPPTVTEPCRRGSTAIANFGPGVGAAGGKVKGTPGAREGILIPEP